MATDVARIDLASTMSQLMTWPPKVADLASLCDDERRGFGFRVRIDLDAIHASGMARLSAPTGAGKTEAAMYWWEAKFHQGVLLNDNRRVRQLKQVWPAVLEAKELAHRIKVLAGTATFSHGVDVDDLIRRGRALLLRDTTYIRLYRVAPDLFTVAQRRPVPPRVGDRAASEAEPLRRRIRRLLAGLSLRTVALADVLAEAARRLLRGCEALWGWAISLCENTSSDAPPDVLVAPSPRLTRGPTSSRMRSVLSASGELVYA